MTLTVIHDIVTMRALGFGSGFLRAMHHPLALLRSHCCTQSYGTAPHIKWDARFWNRAIATLTSERDDARERVEDVEEEFRAATDCEAADDS